MDFGLYWVDPPQHYPPNSNSTDYNWYSYTRWV